MNKPMTPDEFFEKMIQAKERFDNDPESVHVVMDGIMCNLLESLGYGEGVIVFDHTYKYYA